ncbi:MAG: hypothetical protein ACRDTJ_09780 [Pseudonocardiaceae bacterium]
MSTQEFKVEPEWVVGQQIQDEDYDRLPVGAKVGTLEKTGEHEWRDISGVPLFQQPHATRVLLHLPDAPDPEAYCVKDAAEDGDWWASEDTPEFGYGIVYSDGTHPTKTSDLESIEANFGIDATQPEDATDAYVEPLTEPSVDNSEDLTEPESLEDDQYVLVWARVVDAKPDIDGEIQMYAGAGEGGDRGFYLMPNDDAIVRPEAGQVPPWVKPARCTSLATRAEDEGTFARCVVTQHDPHDFHNDGPKGGTWTTAEESGRLVESGGAA